VAVRFPLVSLLDFSSDATDPIVSALRMLQSWNPLQGSSARFGYGRSLSYVPLVVGVDDGLRGFASRRIVAQALIAPVSYVSVRMLISGAVTTDRRWGEEITSVLCAAAAAGLLVVNQDLLQNLLWGHHGYFGPEWAALLMLGFSGLLMRRNHVIWSALTGVSLAMCVMNHPYALSLAPLLWVVWSAGREDREPERSRAALIAGGVAFITMLPHAAYLLLSPGGAGDILESVVPPSVLSMSRPIEVAQGLFSNIDGPSALLFGGSLLLVLSVPLASRGPTGGGPLARPLSRVGMGAALSFTALLLLGLASRQVHNWHWRMLIPLGVACVGLALAWLVAQLRSSASHWIGVRVFLFLGACLAVALLFQTMAAGCRSFQSPAEQPRESLLQLGHIEQIYAAIEQDSGEIPWTIIAIGSPPEQSYARLLPLGLQRVLSPESPLLFSTFQGDFSDGLALYYFEGPSGWIESLAEHDDLRAAALLWRGAHSLALRVDSRSQSLAAAEALCAVSEQISVRVDSPRDLVALLEMMGLAAQPEMQQFPHFSPACLRLAH